MRSTTKYSSVIYFIYQVFHPQQFSAGGYGANSDSQYSMQDDTLPGKKEVGYFCPGHDECF